VDIPPRSSSRVWFRYKTPASLRQVIATFRWKSSESAEDSTCEGLLASAVETSGRGHSLMGGYALVSKRGNLWYYTTTCAHVEYPFRVPVRDP